MNDTTERVRVRFAPSPTGPLHMGGIRTALYNYLFAKKHGGDFIVRIEDTDEKRRISGAQTYIHEALRWCGIEPDEGVGYSGELGPYIQSERKHLYRPYAEQLVKSGHAYLAFDTPEELEQTRLQAKQMGLPNWQYNSMTRSSMKNSLSLSKESVEEQLSLEKPYAIRVKMPRNETVKFEDRIRGWVNFNTNHLDDKVIVKPNGMPTYHLANVVDDHLMQITHVIRGEEWLPSAPLHLLLYDALKWERPEFAHLPLILRPDGKGKLSKRDGDQLGFPVFPIEWKTAEGAVYEGYRESGYFPEAFINMLSLLGWNPGDNEEIFSLEELTRRFTLERVGKSGARFDPDKTKWFNQYYLRHKSNEELAEHVAPLLDDAVDADYLAKVCGLLKERATFAHDIAHQGSYFFREVDTYATAVVRKKWKAESPEIMRELAETLTTVQTWNAAQIETTFSEFLEKTDRGFGKVGPCFRLLLTGEGMGPSLFDICELLGKEKVLRRLSEGIENVQRIKRELSDEK